MPTTTISLPEDLRDDLKADKPDDMAMYEYLRALHDQGEVYLIDAERVLDGLDERGVTSTNGDVVEALARLQQDVDALSDRIATLETELQTLRQ